jgi:hypothetical protein
MHELAGEGVGEPTLVASRARTYRHEKNIRILGGSFVLASRVCARIIEPRIRTSRRDGGNARHSASNRLDQLKASCLFIPP